MKRNTGGLRELERVGMLVRERGRPAGRGVPLLFQVKRIVAALPVKGYFKHEVETGNMYYLPLHSLFRGGRQEFTRTAASVFPSLTS